MPELTEATFGHVAHVRKMKICRLLLKVLCVCAKDTKQKKVSLKFPEGNITSAKLQAEWIFGIRVPFVKNVSCSRESMAEYIDHTPAKSSPAKRRRFQMFKKTYYEKWPFITLTRKVTLV